MQPRWHEPKNTAEGELLQHVLQLEQIVKGRMDKNMNCMNCSDDSCPSCSKKASKAGKIKVTDADKANNKVFADIMGDGDEDTAHKNYDKAREMDRGEGNMTKSSMVEKNKYCQKNFGCSYSECTPKQKSQCNKNCGAETGSYKSDRGQKGMPALKGRGGMLSNFDLDKTAEFLASKGVIVKYEQEGSVENGVPQFMDHSGGTPIEARPYQTNGTYPDFNQVAPKVKGISEVAKMPAYAKTGYDEKGSSVHMHLTDGGDRKDGNWNMAPIEESLTQLRKGYGNPGIIEEIASLMENVAKNL